MTVSLIVAAAENNVIGIENKMPWHIPEDFKHFKTLTMGKPCIMGRKTFESIVAQLGKPLPGRTSLVVSRSGFAHDGAVVCGSLADAISEARKISDGEIMVIGGAQIYVQALEQNLVDRIYLTRVHQSPDGDAFFPALGPEWKETERTNHAGFSFVQYDKPGD